MRKFNVIHLDHSDNETTTEVSANSFDVLDSGDLVFYDETVKVITAFARGRWHRVTRQDE